MKLTKQIIINKIIDIEDGYAEIEGDPITKYGITEPVARENGYEGDMIDLSESLARDIYSKKYWSKINGDSLLKLDDVVAFKIMDFSIHSGVWRASSFLQNALNILSTDKELVVDGIIGSKTLSYLDRYLTTRGSNVLSKSIDCLRGAFLLNQNRKDVIHGWINKRINFETRDAGGQGQTRPPKED